MLLLHKAFLNHSFRRGLIVCRPFFGRRLATAPDVPGVKETALESLTIPYATLSELGEELRWPFEDNKTLATALVHRSVINSGIEHKVFAEVRPGVITRLDDNNEKLELLGDKVFGLLACNHVFHNYNSLSEGQMSQSVHSIVSRRSADYFCRYSSRNHCFFFAFSALLTSRLAIYRKLHLNRFMVIAFHVQKSSGRGATQRGDFFEVS